MKITKVTSLSISINNDITFLLNKEEVFALYLWSSGISWEKGTISLHAVKLEKNIFVSQENSFCYGFNLSAVNIFNDPDSEEFVTFAMTENYSIRVYRKELFQLLEQFVLGEISPVLSIPTEAVPFSNTFVEEQGLLWENGFSIGESPVNLFLKEGYLRFVTEEKYGEKFDIVDSHLFFNNKNLSRPSTVKYLSFSSKVYFGGYRGKERKSHIRISVINNSVEMDTLSI